VSEQPIVVARNVGVVAEAGAVMVMEVRR